MSALCHLLAQGAALWQVDFGRRRGSQITLYPARSWLCRQVRNISYDEGHSEALELGKVYEIDPDRCLEFQD